MSELGGVSAPAVVTSAAGDGGLGGGQDSDGFWQQPGL